MAEVFDPSGTSEDTEKRILKEENEELRARLEKYEGDKVIEGQFGGELPRYRLNIPMYLEGDNYLEAGTEIEYTNQPNLEMVPLNDSARARMADLIEAMERNAREDAERRGVAFTGLITDNGTLIARARQDALRAPQSVTIAMPEERGEVPAMPHTPEAAAIRRKRGRPPKSAVISAKAPPPPPKPGAKPEPILGTRYSRASGEGSVA